MSGSNLNSKERIIVATNLLESLSGVTLETTGDTSSDFADGLISRALSRLNMFERTIIERYFYQGESVVDIASSLKSTPQKVEEGRKRAFNSMKEYLKIEAKCLDLTSSHNNCIICDHPESIEINKCIRDLLETSGFRYFGIPKRLITRFKFNALSTEQLHDHVEHMGRLSDTEVCGDDDSFSGKKTSLNFVVPIELREKAEDLAALCGTNHIAIVKHALVEGLDILERYLIYNAEFSRRAISVHRKLRKLDV